MKKLLGIVVLGLLWGNAGSSYELRKVVESLRCYETTLWIRTLDIDKEDNTEGNVLNYNTYDSEKKPELTLVITVDEVEPESWKGGVMTVSHYGKEEYKLTKIDMPGDNLEELYAGQINSNGDVRGLKLTKEITFNSFRSDDTKKDIYYELELTYFSGKFIKFLNNKKKTIGSYDVNRLTTSSNKLFCFK